MASILIIISRKLTIILRYAIRKNDYEAIGYLLSRGINPQTSNHMGKNALHYAVEFDSILCLAIMLEGVWIPSTDFTHPFPNTPWLENAWKSLDSATQSDGLLPFHIAAIRGNKDILEYLVNFVKARKKTTKGKNMMGVSEMMEYSTKYSLTPLLLTIQYNHAECFEYLTTVGANIYAMNTRMQNGLHIGVINNNRMIMDWFLIKDREKCSLINAKDYRGRIPADYSISENIRISLLSIWSCIANENLLDIQTLATKTKGSILRMKHSNNSNSPLHYAVLLGKVAVVELLVELEALKTSKNSEGMTPINLAEKIENPIIRESMLNILNKTETDDFLLSKIRKAKTRRLSKVEYTALERRLTNVNHDNGK